jgi:SAM-dependent methyltransferase
LSIYNEDYYESEKLQYTQERFTPFFQEIGKLFHEKGFRRTLDVGCAKGFSVKAFRDLGLNAFGVDTSNYAICAAPKEISAFVFEFDFGQDGSAGRFIEKTDVDSFDLITLFEVVEHIADDTLHVIIANLVDLLIDDGVFLVTTPFKRHRNEHPSHINVKSKEEWIEFFSRYESLQLTSHLNKEYDLAYERFLWRKKPKIFVGRMLDKLGMKRIRVYLSLKRQMGWQNPLIFRKLKL